MRCSCLIGLFLVGIARAIPQPGPAPTHYEPNLPYQGVSPRPTARVELRSPAELFKRQDDRTCGYVAADYENAATCNSGYYCAYNTRNMVFGCCSGAITDCYLETTCYPSTAVVASCDSSCQANPYNYLCTAGSKTLCHVYVSIYGATRLSNYGCGTRTFTSSVYPTYTNTPSDAVFSSRSSIKPSALTNPLPTQLTSRKPEDPLGQSSSVTAPPQSATPTPAPPGNKTPVGPIIGGVIGGLALLAIAAVAIILLLRRSKNTQQAPQAVQQPVQQPVQQTYYNPKPDPYMQPYGEQPYGQQPYGQQPMSPPPTGPSTSPPMSPPMSPAPPYGQYVYPHNAPAMTKGVHEVG